ncbi:MAG: PAS domain-containing sensor histidine kinase [Candidatus Acidiferrales bacterium]
MDFFRQLFSSGDFQPHGFCYLWNSRLIWLHVISDSLIALAYFTIPLTLLWFIRKRRDMPFSWMFVCFGVFIVACGTTHLMEIWNLWHANYWLAGAIKAVTAAASIVTALLLIRLVPQALDLPSLNQWVHANAALQKEVQDRRELELNLRISESMYREQAELLDLTHDAVFVRGLSDKILFWNRAAERLYGWQKEEVRGKTTHELLQTEFPRPLSDIEAELFEKGVWEGELIHARRDGSTVTVSSRWALRTDQSGKPVSILISNRDITQRRADEQALRRSEELFRVLVSGVKDYAILMLDQEGKVISWNEGAERIKGYRPDEILGQHFSKFYPAEDIASGKPARELKIATETGQFEEDGWRVRKDGSQFWANVVVSALRSENGELRGFAKVTRDITERKRAESKFRDLLESAPDAIVIVNDQGRIVLTNAQTEKLFGYQRHELLDQPVEILVPHRFHGEHVGNRKNYAVSPRPRSMGAGLELYGRRKDGTEFPVEISLSPLETSEGKLISSAIRDVSERKKFAEALKASEERLQMALDAAQLGVWDLDLGTDTTFRSLRHDQIFGFESLQPEWGIAIATTHVVPEDRGAFRSSFDQAFRSNVFSLECRIHRAQDGALRWVSAQGRVYRDDAGKPSRVMGVVSDTTERKLAEQEVERHRQSLARSNADLAAVNKELEAFSYSVSHDLRAPLRHIDGFARILKEEHAAELSVEAQRYLDRVLHGANLMGHLVDDLLNLAKIGRRELVRQKTNLDSLVREAIADLPETENRAVEWRLEPLPEVDCDPGLLRLVFNNLLSNALKFTRGRQPAVIEIGAQELQGATTFFVRDNGVGFDPKYADKLFGVFQRLHRQEDFEGTGVGLATVQRIIHKHGGEVRAESEIDRGTTFFFTLGAAPLVSLTRQPVEVVNRA